MIRYFLFFISMKIILLGIVIFSLTAFYLFIVSQISVNNSFQTYKEPITAFIYATAVWGTASVEHLTLFPCFVGMIFFLIAFQNLLLFSFFELLQFPESSNLVKLWGLKTTQKIILGIFIFIVLSGGFCLINLSNLYQQKVIGMEMLMSLGLCLTLYFQKLTLPEERYRWLGDGVFLLPLLII